MQRLTQGDTSRYKNDLGRREKNDLYNVCFCKHKREKNWSALKRDSGRGKVPEIVGKWDGR